MNEFTQGYLVGVASIWVGVAVILMLYFLAGFFGTLFRKWRHKQELAGEPVAHVISLVEDADGIMLTAKVDDPETFRLINNGTIRGISLDMHPNAFGQGLTFVQTNMTDAKKDRLMIRDAQIPDRLVGRCSYPERRIDPATGFSEPYCTTHSSFSHYAIRGQNSLLPCIALETKEN